jgi:hypothetical protein
MKMISIEQNSYFVHQVFLTILPTVKSSSKTGGTGEVNDEFCLTNCLFYTSKGSLTFRIILHGAGGFSYPTQESVLQIFIALKNPSP